MKNKSFYFLLLSFFLIYIPRVAMAQIYNSGTIEYQRQTNLYRLTENNRWGDMFKTNKFSTDTFTLVFDSVESIYSVPNYTTSRDMGFFSFRMSPDASSAIYKNHKTDTIIAKRLMQEEEIAIIDSIRKIDWKVTDEYRDILGFYCQKYVGVIYDSVYVVAFVTDQIETEDGPETFGGLPGMIMGLAIPRLFTTWMAVSYSPDRKYPIKSPPLPKSKYRYNYKQFEVKTKESFGDWGDAFLTLNLWFWGL